MSRDTSRQAPSLSAAQRRACIVVVCCVLAVVLSFVLAWVVLPSLLGGSDIGDYDPNAYPVDTTLPAVLTESAEISDYMAGTVLVGDQYAASLQSQGLITLDEFVGAPGMTISSLLSEPSVYFLNDANGYTVPQALNKMKPRRMVLCLGSNDMATATGADTFVAQYAAMVATLGQAYSYSDIIINAIPPVLKGSQGAGARQTLIDQCNQALAVMCQNNGYHFLNSAQALKDKNGFAQDSYFDNASGAYTATGGNALLLYIRQHPLASEDRRPDTTGIPQRAAQPGSAQAVLPTQGPSPTPGDLTATYTVEDVNRGTLTYGTESGQPRVEVKVGERTSVTVTAVPKEGWTFVKWSDGQTSATRTDVIMEDFSCVAIFVQPQVKIYLNGSGCDNGQDLTAFVKTGGSYSFTAKVLIDGVPDNNMTNRLKWVINRNDNGNDPNLPPYAEAAGGSYTFAPTEGGEYDIIVGLVLDGMQEQNVVSSYVTASLPEPEPEPAPDPTLTLMSDCTDGETTVGTAIKLTADAENGSGSITWKASPGTGTWGSGDQGTASVTGNEVVFTPNAEGAYTFTATFSGVTGQIQINVRPAAEPED